MAKDTTDKNEDFTSQLKDIQEQICELVLESQILKQDRDDQATRLATLE